LDKRKSALLKVPFTNGKCSAGAGEGEKRCRSGWLYNVDFARKVAGGKKSAVGKEPTTKQKLLAVNKLIQTLKKGVRADAGDGGRKHEKIFPGDEGHKGKSRGRRSIKKH